MRKGRPGDALAINPQTTAHRRLLAAAVNRDGPSSLANFEQSYLRPLPISEFADATW